MFLLLSLLVPFSIQTSDLSIPLKNSYETISNTLYTATLNIGAETFSSFITNLFRGGFSNANKITDPDYYNKEIVKKNLSQSDDFKQSAFTWLILAAINIKSAIISTPHYCLSAINIWSNYNKNRNYKDKPIIKGIKKIVSYATYTPLFVPNLVTDTCIRRIPAWINQKSSFQTFNYVPYLFLSFVKEALQIHYYYLIYLIDKNAAVKLSQLKNMSGISLLWSNPGYIVGGVCVLLCNRHFDLIKQKRLRN